MLLQVDRLATALDKTGTTLSNTGCESAMFSRPASKAPPSRTQRMRLAFGEACHFSFRLSQLSGFPASFYDAAVTAAVRDSLGLSDFYNNY